MNKESLNGYFDKTALSEDKKTEIKNALRQKFPQYTEIKTQTDKSDEIIKNTEPLKSSAKVKSRRLANGIAIAAAAAIMITAGGAYLYKAGQEDIPTAPTAQDVDIDYYDKKASELYAASQTTIVDLSLQGFIVTSGTADTETYSEALSMNIDSEMYRLSRSSMNDYPLVGFMLRLMEIIDENNYDIDLEHLDFEIVIGDNNNLRYVSINVGEDNVTYPSSEAIEVIYEMQSKADYLARCLYVSGREHETSDLVDDYMKYDEDGDDGLVEISYSKGSYNSPVSEDNPNTIADYVDMLNSGDTEKLNKVYQDFSVKDGTDPQLIMLQVLSSLKSFVSVEDFELLINSDVVLHYGESDKDFYAEVTLDDGTYSMWNAEKTYQEDVKQLYEAASECYKLLDDQGIHIQFDNVNTESIMKAMDIMQENALSSYGKVYEYCLDQTDGFIIYDEGFAAYLNQYLSDNGYTSNMIANGYTLNLEDFEQFTIVFDTIEEMNADFATGVKAVYVNNKGIEAYYPENINRENIKEFVGSENSENDIDDFSDAEKLYNSALLFYIDLKEKGYTVDASEITDKDLINALLSSANLGKLSETDKNVSAEQFAYLVYRGCLENSFEGGKLYGELDLTTLDNFTIVFDEDEDGNRFVSRVRIVVEGDMVFEYPPLNDGQEHEVNANVDD